MALGCFRLRDLRFSARAQTLDPVLASTFNPQVPAVHPIKSGLGLGFAAHPWPALSSALINPSGHTKIKRWCFETAAPSSAKHPLATG